MEKQLAEERDKDWQGQTHQDGEERKASTQEAWICPCGVYSRTSHRLRLALGGRNAVDIPQHPVITADCCECMLCFPFYGLFIAKLQDTVRSFYAIDGSVAKDWRDGCLCPCTTLARNEEEIFYREQLRKKVEDGKSSIGLVSSPYQSPPTLGSTSSLTSSAPDGLNTIEETSREASRGPSRRPSCKKPQTHNDTTSANPASPNNASLVLVHCLDKDPSTALAKEEDVHQLKDDVLVPKAASHDPHDMHHDPSVALDVEPTQIHELGVDQVGLADHGQSSHKHAIHHDAVVKQPPKTTPHHLQDDVIPQGPGSIPQSKGTTSHLLWNDAMTEPRKKKPGAHTLDSDAKGPATSSRSKPHGLKDH